MSTQIGVFKHQQLDVWPASGEWLTLSLTQPYASALFVPGLKQIETRGWKTHYRGRLYIHASKGFPKRAREFAEEEHEAGRLPHPSSLPLGAIIGHVELVEIRRTEELVDTISETEERYGDYGPRRYGWIFIRAQLLPEPIPATGQLGLWRFHNA